jgi:predicted nucleotidyltransferase
VVSAAEGLRRLRAAARSSSIDALCARHSIRVLTAFGSAVRDDPNARDLDVAVILEPGHHADYPSLIADLVDLTDADVDLVVLNGAGPLIRERALVEADPLFESEEGAWSRAATAAAVERMDTDWMREIGLRLLAER